MRADPWLTPLLDTAGMRAADRWAIEDREVPSLKLMEAAGAAVAEEVAALAPDGVVRFVCGKGNNAGDGLVAARLLMAQGFEVEVILLWPPEELSPDSKNNLGRYPGDARRPEVSELGAVLEGSSAIVDAVFGTGFGGAPRAPADTAIRAINSAGAPVVACDIASGLDASTGAAEGDAVIATRTVTFHAAKVGHHIAPGKWHTGDLTVAPIGIPEGAPDEPAAGLIGTSVLGELPERGKRSSKFSSGSVLLVGGSRGLTGAICMASQAAIRAGAGYASAAAPKSLEPILEVKLTEVMTVALAEHRGSLDPGAADPVLERSRRADCVVLGPGLGREKGAAELARRLATEVEAPLLIDADGLRAIAGELEQIASSKRPLILTPHEGELSDLLGGERAVAQCRLEAAKEAAQSCSGIVVLKGDGTIVTDGDRVAINDTPSPGLATAGTGDVLSGTIAALVARGSEPWQAACAGVLAHARAGRRAADRVGAESVIATDVIEALPAGLTR